jgi:colicin import membrane protein
MFKSLTLPLIITLFFHGLILAVILIDAPKASSLVKRAQPNFIRAELITLDKAKAKKTAPKPVKKPTPKPKKQVQKDNSKAEALAKKKQLEIAQQKKQAELDKLAKQKQQLKELEKQREQEKIDRIKQQNADEMLDAINEEHILAQSLSDDQLANSYVALITEAIQTNWNRPPSARNNMEAELILQLVPTGEVVSVKVLRSSGNAAFDRSAENAVLKAERFPELKNLPSRVFEKNFRRLRLKFKPEDLRL